MKNGMSLAILAILSIAVPGFGQVITATQDGSVAIADSVGRVTIIKDSTVCVADFVKAGGTIEAASKFCLKVVETASDMVKRGLNEAADATKSSKPLVVLSRYGGGGSCWNCSNNDRTNAGSTNRVAMEDRNRQRADQARARDERAASATETRAEIRAEQDRERKKILEAQEEERKRAN